MGLMRGIEGDWFNTMVFKKLENLEKSFFGPMYWLSNVLSEVFWKLFMMSLHKEYLDLGLKINLEMGKLCKSYASLKFIDLLEN